MMGVAVFDARDALLRAIASAKAQQVTIVTTFSPAYDHEVLTAADVARSSVPRWALTGGVVGAISGLALTVWTVRQWPVLMLGGKPLIALPSFLIIAFELTILVGVCATVAGFFVGCRRMRRIARSAYDSSLSDGRFGLVLACPSERGPAMGELMRDSGAASWRVV